MALFTKWTLIADYLRVPLKQRIRLALLQSSLVRSRAQRVQKSYRPSQQWQWGASSASARQLHLRPPWKKRFWNPYSRLTAIGVTGWLNRVSEVNISLLGSKCSPLTKTLSPLKSLNASHLSSSTCCLQSSIRTRGPEWRCCRCAASTQSSCRAHSRSALMQLVCPLLSTRPPPLTRQPQMASFFGLFTWQVWMGIRTQIQFSSLLTYSYSAL